MAKTNSKTEEFLQKYRKLEQALRTVYGDSMTVREYEGMDETNAKKLQICRLLRNYASHETDLDSFCPVPAETGAFLSLMTDFVLSQVQTVKERMKRMKALNGSESLSYAAKRLANCPKMPVTDEKKCLRGVMTNEVLRREIAAGKEVSFPLHDAKLEPVSAEQCTAPNERVPAIQERLASCGVLFVTENGERYGKYLGVLISLENGKSPL